MAAKGDSITKFVSDTAGSLTGSVKSLISDITNIGDVVDNWTDQVGKLFDGLFDKYQGGLDGFLDNIISSSGGDATTTINQLAGGNQDPQVTAQVVSLINQGDINTAASIMAENSDFTEPQLQEILSRLDVTIAGQIIVVSSTAVLPSPYSIGSDQAKWSGSNSQNYPFSYVSSVEELQGEFRSVKRQVTEVVVHWTDTYTNANLTAQQIHDAHNAVGHNGIGYHYVIRRDGSLQRGRPVDVQGEHASNNGHDQYSIAVAFVGGYNCPTGTNNPETYKSVSSLTRQQFTTFKQFIQQFYLAFPGGQVFGHNDVDTNEIDPGFDVQDYCFAVFGKTSLIEDPSTSGPLSRQDIIDMQQQQNNATVVFDANNVSAP